MKNLNPREMNRIIKRQRQEITELKKKVEHWKIRYVTAATAHFPPPYNKMDISSFQRSSDSDVNHFATEIHDSESISLLNKWMSYADEASKIQQEEASVNEPGSFPLYPVDVELDGQTDVSAPVEMNISFKFPTPGADTLVDTDSANRVLSTESFIVVHGPGQDTATEDPQHPIYPEINFDKVDEIKGVTGDGPKPAWIVALPPDASLSLGKCLGEIPARSCIPGVDVKFQGCSKGWWVELLSNNLDDESGLFNASRIVITLLTWQKLFFEDKVSLCRKIGYLCKAQEAFDLITPDIISEYKGCKESLPKLSMVVDKGLSTESFSQRNKEIFAEIKQLITPIRDSMEFFEVSGFPWMTDVIAAYKDIE